ncbi:MAG: hypothetical protein ACP5U1_07355 [Desulfomonilaceae bacterium]
MEKESKIYENLTTEYEELRSRLNEAEDALDAIRSGAIDAPVVSGPDGPKIYALSGADAVYRMFFQEMADGGLTVNSEGTILFSDESLS